ncbi:MAG: phosphoadenosine phosphosulfate reductase family protein, partial [Thermoplasmata archaeon]|nr:phosphoadenosine phosphosulfate reductase family protein [Thermoplasmata archaeon]
MFDPEKFVNESIKKLKSEITGTAVIACSGGVDSTVVAVLVSRAIDDRLYGVHVDTGYMRKNESKEVAELLRGMGVNLQVAEAGEEFSEDLKGAIEPEAKRKAIGERFIRIFERYAREIDAKYLVQGTIAPDWIESGGELRDTIKSHHNVGALPEDMDLTLV